MLRRKGKKNRIRVSRFIIYCNLWCDFYSAFVHFTFHLYHILYGYTRSISLPSCYRISAIFLHANWISLVHCNANNLWVECGINCTPWSIRLRRTVSDWTTQIRQYKCVMYIDSASHIWNYNGNYKLWLSEKQMRFLIQISEFLFVKIKSSPSLSLWSSRFYYLNIHQKDFLILWEPFGLKVSTLTSPQPISFLLFYLTPTVDFCNVR